MLKCGDHIQYNQNGDGGFGTIIFIYVLRYETMYLITTSRGERLLRTRHIIRVTKKSRGK